MFIPDVMRRLTASRRLLRPLRPQKITDRRRPLPRSHPLGSSPDSGVSARRATESVWTAYGGLLRSTSGISTKGDSVDDPHQSSSPQSPSAEIWVVSFQERRLLGRCRSLPEYRELIYSRINRSSGRLTDVSAQQELEEQMTLPLSRLPSPPKSDEPEAS